MITRKRQSYLFNLSPLAGSWQNANELFADADECVVEVREDDIKDMRGCLSLQLSFHGGGVNGSSGRPPPPPRRRLCKKPRIINYT